MLVRYLWGAMVVTGIVGCSDEKNLLPESSPAQIEVSSDTAIAFLSCMSDHPPLVNPIVFWLYSVPEGGDCCFDGVYGLQLYFNDALFLTNPLGAWQFTGQDGFLSLDPNDDTPHFRSRLNEYRDRENDIEHCILDRKSFTNININITSWDWDTFIATYDGTLENGDLVAGNINGMWREDINDCDEG